MRTPHKLAAVLFADIAGYTAMMAESESLALEKLSIFKEKLNKALLLNSGQLVQYFGDGALCTFESSVMAVECAIYLQSALGKGTLVPLRIGIHTGDVVYKDGNVYGDAVNIASRIESIGKAGTVLVSASTMRQVKSNSELKFTSLGGFRFKNIPDDIEVYALSSDGFRVPDRKYIEGKLEKDPSARRAIREIARKFWLGLLSVIALGAVLIVTGGDYMTSWLTKSPFEEILDNGLVIFDFENKTGDPQYDQLQCRIHGQLKSHFLKYKIPIKNNSTLCHNNRYYTVVKSKISPGEQLENLLGTKFALEGYIFKNPTYPDSIGLHASVFKTFNSEVVLETEDILVHEKEIDQGINKLARIVLNFWKLKDDPIFSEHRPLPGWHEEYSKAIYYFDRDPYKVLYHVNRCDEIDSTQHRDDILEIELYGIYGMYEQIDSIIDILEFKNDQMTEGEINLLNVHKALRNDNNQAACEYFKNEYRKDPKNLVINFSMMSYSVMFNNDTKFALEVADEIQYDLIDYNNCSYCQSRLTIMARALIDEKQYEDALSALRYADALEANVHNSGNYELQIRAMVRMDNEEAIKDILDITKHKEFSKKRNFAYFLYWTSNEYFLAGNIKLAEKYRLLFEEEIVQQPSLGHKVRLARLALNFEEFSIAELLLREIVKDDQLTAELNSIYYALLGYALAKQDFDQESEDVITLLENKKTPLNEADIAYFQGQIALGQGNTERALALIQKSILKGKHFTRWEYHNDPLLLDIHNNDEFLRMINQS